MRNYWVLGGWKLVFLLVFTIVKRYILEYFYKKHFEFYK